MKFKSLFGAVALLGLAACASTAADDTPAPAFNAAACVAKDFVIYSTKAKLNSRKKRARYRSARRDIRGCTIDSYASLAFRSG